MSTLAWPGDERAGDLVSDAALLHAMVSTEAAWLAALVDAGIADPAAASARCRPRRLTEPQPGAVTECEERGLGGVLRLRSGFQRACWCGREVRIDQARAARTRPVMPGDLDRPGRADVDDDHLFVAAAAMDPHPHDLTEQRVWHRVLAALEGDHRHRRRDPTLVRPNATVCGSAGTGCNRMRLPRSAEEAHLESFEP